MADGKTHDRLGGALGALLALLRSNAEDHCRAKQADALKSRNTADWLLWSLASGIGPALAAGHISHIALDAQTPRGIPFLSA
jgi:hypothetical protein